VSNDRIKLPNTGYTLPPAVRERYDAMARSEADARLQVSGLKLRVAEQDATIASLMRSLERCTQKPVSVDAAPEALEAGYRQGIEDALAAIDDMRVNFDDGTDPGPDRLMQGVDCAREAVEDCLGLDPETAEGEVDEGFIVRPGYSWGEPARFTSEVVIGTAEAVIGDLQARLDEAEQRAKAAEAQVERLRADVRVLACQWRAVDDLEDCGYFQRCWELAQPEQAKAERAEARHPGHTLGLDPGMADLVPVLSRMVVEIQPVAGGAERKVILI